MFVWADAGLDTVPLAEAMLEQGYLMAPGSLFSPDQRPSTWMRFNVATSGNPRMLAALEATLARTRQRLKSGDPPR
jgi:DNA-binding transcriptional MocR family regulator